MPLSDDRIARWSRQLLLPDMGEAGQERLALATVRVVGAGPVAGPALLYLAEAGVGRILVDDAMSVSPEDRPALLYPPSREGTPRAAGAIGELARASRFTVAELFQLGMEHAAVLVAADEPELAQRASDEARRNARPHVVAQGQGDGGYVAVLPAGAPCFACAVPAPPTGLLPDAAASAAVGALAALELVLLLAGTARPPLPRRVQMVHGRPETRPVKSRPGCACGGQA